MRLIDQLFAIARTIKGRVLTPGRRYGAVLAEHTFPRRPRMWWFHQGISEVAQHPLILGELEIRCSSADAGGCLRTEPSVHVITSDALAHTAEVAAAAPGEHGVEENRCQNDKF